MKTIVPRRGESPLELLHRCGGYYKSPVDTVGNFIGPLVGYAGEYKVDDATTPSVVECQYVGFEYVDFAAIEEHGPALAIVAEKLVYSIASNLYRCNHMSAEFHRNITGFVGAPEGGKALAATMSILSSMQYMFPDKVVTKVKSDSHREKSTLVWGRHTLTGGEKWVLVEDVCNNFTTTASLITLIESTGAEVVAIACFLNRTVNPEYKEFFTPKDGRKIPVMAVVCQEIPEYKQEDPTVADLLKKPGNVFWKPKDNRSELMAAMGVPQV